MWAGCAFLVGTGIHMADLSTGTASIANLRVITPRMPEQEPSCHQRTATARISAMIFTVMEI